MMISRRMVLAASAAMPFAGMAHAADAVSIQIHPQRLLRRLPGDFIGLGFEASAVAVPGFLSSGNRAYVQLVRNLGRGVIRIGGNVSDYTRYEVGAAPAWGYKATVLNYESLRQLRGFLDATGWKLIWGLNLGTGTVENAVAAARAVTELMGDRLVAFQIGNEPDLFVLAGHRAAPYGYGEWLTQYRRFKAAIRAALPGARFAGPDISDAGVAWVEAFARDEGGEAAMLTAHHYIAGKDNLASTHALLLRDEIRFQQNNLARFQASAVKAGISWRMSETATLYGGGKKGVSDSFASALWVLDYLFVLAGHGAAGANLQTGINHLGRLSYYSPLTDDQKGNYGAAPGYYGLLAFAQVSQGDLVAVDLNKSGVNLTAYAVREEGGIISVAVINKDINRDAAVAISGAPQGEAQAMRLAAPSVSALSGVTLGGARVSGDGRWGGQSEAVRIRGGQALLNVPAGSAALVTFTA
jgi:Glycosyl hydrolase family 79 C-terminal beta domain